MAFRAWCFTQNNPDGLLLDFSTHPKVKYAIYQYEIGANGTPHYQGYIECNTPVRIAYLKGIDGISTAHFEKRKGTREEARDYCKKKDDTFLDGPWEYGKWTGGQGTRSDLNALKELIVSGADDKSIFEAMPGEFLRFRQAIRDVRTLYTPQRNQKTPVTFVYGDPGLGKTYWVSQQHPNLYWKQPSQWWDGYNGTDPVVLDDYYGYLTATELLMCLDAYPHQVQVKGGQVNFNPLHIYITSNRTPNTWYKDGIINTTALERRIDSWIIFDEPHRYIVLPDAQDFYIAQQKGYAWARLHL